MFLRLWVLLILFFPLCHLGHSSSSNLKSKDFKVTVQSLDPHINLNSLDKGIYEIKEGFPADSRAGRAPIAHDLDQALVSVGLMNEVKGFDRLDKNLFYGRAKNYSLEELKSYYPKLDKRKLANFQREIKND